MAIFTKCLEEISDMKFGTGTIRSVTYGNGKFVAVGDSGKGAYSLNLIS